MVFYKTIQPIRLHFYLLFAPDLSTPVNVHFLTFFDWKRYLPAGNGQIMLIFQSMGCLFAPKYVYLNFNEQSTLLNFRHSKLTACTHLSFVVSCCICSFYLLIIYTCQTQPENRLF